MNLAIVTHPACRSHAPPHGHPEQPARLDAVLRGLEAVSDCDFHQATPAADSAILRVHTADYLAELRRLDSGSGGVALDPDTWLGPGSLDAAVLAAGAACKGVELVLDGDARRAFAAVRPPGHHAEPGCAMGFCLINGIAVAAADALTREGIGRVVIADFDVHHGNGTQAMFEADPRVAYASSHQSPLYPGTGGDDETGCGNVFNVALRPGSGGAEFRAAWRDRLLPALRAAAPDMVFVSAGFDGHRLDPLANLELEVEDFAWIGHELATLADECAAGRLVAVLEGGYHQEALRDCAAAFAEAIRGD